MKEADRRNGAKEGQGARAGEWSTDLPPSTAPNVLKYRLIEDSEHTTGIPPTKSFLPAKAALEGSSTTEPRMASSARNEGSSGATSPSSTQQTHIQHADHAGRPKTWPRIPKDEINEGNPQTRTVQAAHFKYSAGCQPQMGIYKPQSDGNILILWKSLHLESRPRSSSAFSGPQREEWSPAASDAELSPLHRRRPTTA